MGLVVPYPNTPQNGQSGDATPINANFTAIAQAIQSFDGAQIASGTVVAGSLNSTINPITRDNLTINNFISSGCVWSIVSGLQGTMSGGTIFINGNMVTVSGVVSHTFTASQDTYVDVDYNGNVYYQGVSNNTTSPSITANSVRVAIIITGGSSISFVNQGQLDTTLSGFAPIISSVSLTCTDSLGNLIYPTDPHRRMIGYRQITTNFTTAAATTDTLIPGLSCSFITPRNGKVKATIYAAGCGATAASTKTLFFQIEEGSSVYQRANYDISTTQSGFAIPLSATLHKSPLSSGLHTFLATVNQTDTGTITISAASTFPAFILIESE